MTQTTTMQAAVLAAYDTPLTLSTIDRPVAAAGQVLVRVHASGVNPLDVKIHAGQAGHARVRLPAILGIDLAGVVVAVGAGVDAFRVGDEVYGMTGGIGGVPGSLAQYAAVDADLLAIKPRNMTMRAAAALPLVFITAWEGLIERARIDAAGAGAPLKVLVQGGAGGVGHIAVQIARAYGADVYATGSAASLDLIAAYGATAIDYRAATPQQYAERYTGGAGFDVVYDTVGGATLDASFGVARLHGGHVVSCLGWGSHALAPLSFRAATYSGVFTLLPLLSGEGRARHGAIMREATRLVEAGQLTILLDERRYTLATVDAAHQAIADGTAKGKLVIEID
ncbi:zinc-dependent alcohol dehydrogenase family protein [Rugamonas sp.]|uniref:zinc-dependent alcohol dehydrogenase family protein n=1 Tax=Rugamonas sp. TaxID=1926287 RepID=UPI0025E00E6D|nr:zinc-dependent alcohol dehydrogenase family protein [Rugamonas sp.]